MQNEKGLSLVEVILAVGLLVLVGSAMVQLGVTALGVSDSSRMRSIAIQLADESLEVARTERDSDPAAFFAISGYRKIDESGGMVPSGLSNTTCTESNVVSNCIITRDVNGSPVNFHRFIQIQTVSGNTNRKEVTAHVYWDNGGGLSNVKTTTVLTRWRD